MRVSFPTRTILAPTVDMFYINGTHGYIAGSPKRFDVFSPSLGDAQRRSRCVQNFLLKLVDTGYARVLVLRNVSIRLQHY